MFLGIFSMSISRKSEMLSAEKLEELLNEIDLENPNYDDNLNLKIKDLKKRRRMSHDINIVHDKDLKETITNLEQNENWEEEQMLNDYQEYKKRDSVNEARPPDINF